MVQGVFRVIEKDAHVHTCFLLPFEKPCVIMGRDLELGIYTVYGLSVAELEPLVLHSDSSTWHRRALFDPLSCSPLILELAAGFGGMGLGARFAGGRSALCVDFNTLSVEHLRANVSCPVLQLDINSPDACALIHAASPHAPMTASFGFPCQPFSMQGRGLGLSDPRATTFWSGLRVIWFLQCQAAILECVATVAKYQVIPQALQKLADAMQWNVHTIVLELSDQLPCKRRRWWALMLPRAWDAFGLRPWTPVNPSPIIESILPSFGHWDEASESDLMLTWNEWQAFANPLFGDDQRLVTSRDVAPTLLHSYANALLPCPCLCRGAGFSLSSLQSKGLRGFAVTSTVHGQARFLHPREATALVGVLDDIRFVHPPRASLCLIGLIASPVQMLWIYGTLLANCALSTGSVPFVDPSDLISSYRDTLKQKLCVSFPFAVPQTPKMVNICAPDGSLLHLVSPLATTVGNFLDAERINLDWGQGHCLRDDAGNRCPIDFTLTHGECYTLDTYSKKHPREKPTGLLAVSIHHKGQLFFQFLRPGQFLFEALREAGIFDVNFLLDDQAMVHAADFRVWRSLQLKTITVDTLAIPRTLVCNGFPSPIFDGLGDQAILSVLEEIVAQLVSDEQALVVSPITADDILKRPFLDFSKLDSWRQIGDSLDFGEIFCVFPARGHWAFLMGRITLFGCSWQYFDGLFSHVTSEAECLARRLTDLLGLDFVDFHCCQVYAQQHSWTCGTIALVHCLFALGFPGFFGQQEIFDLHQWLLREFPVNSQIVAFGPPGLSIDLSNQLVNLLAEHGVPYAAAGERANLIMEKLGRVAVGNALAAKRPWAALKATAGKPNTRLRLVTPEELSQHIQNQAHHKFGTPIDKSKKKSPNHGKHSIAKPVAADPSMLQLYDQHFEDEQNAAVPPIAFQEVGADAHGIALCTAAQAVPFMNLGRSLSAEALALALIDLPDEDTIRQHSITKVTFPAKCTATDEPVLLFGGLMQLGDVKVRRRSAKITPDPEVVSTTVLRIQACRDLLPGDWQTFCRAPIRELVQVTPGLRLCSSPDCQKGAKAECQFAHMPVDEEYEQIIFEIWARQFQSAPGKRVGPEEADSFSAFLRIPKSALHLILQQQPRGFFFEPRDPVHKGPDATYKIIWLPGADYNLALHQAKTFAKSVCIFKLRQRFGIRILARDEELAFKTLRPNASFQAIEVKQIFQLQPIPHGTQRSAIAQLLSEWKWDAKPLQPGPSTASAMSWRVGASTQPPATTLYGFKSDILVTEIKTQQKADLAPTFVASKRTQDLFRRSKPQPADNQDPWEDPKHDPWAAFRSSNASASSAGPPAPAAQKRLDELKDSILKEVQTQAPTATNPQVDQRLQVLESGLTELQHQNGQFKSWFHDLGSRMEHTQASVSQLNSAMQTKQSEITELAAAVQTTNAEVASILDNPKV